MLFYLIKINHISQKPGRGGRHGKTFKGTQIRIRKNLLSRYFIKVYCYFSGVDLSDFVYEWLDGPYETEVAYAEDGKSENCPLNYQFCSSKKFELSEKYEIEINDKFKSENLDLISSCLNLN